MNVDVFSITSFSELKSIYEEIEKDENIIKNELTELYDRKSLLDKDMVNLEAEIPNLDLVQSNSDTLRLMVINAAELADTVSEKVRQLDLAKNRVQQCINRVGDIIDLKACTEGSQKALLKGDYETAANHIKRYLDMDESVLRVTESESAEVSLQILQDATNQLKNIAITKFDEAVRSNNQKEVERFLKIFPQIGQWRLGVEKFGAYLAGKINTEMGAQIKLADVSDPQRYSVKFVDLFTTLLECVAEIINKNQSILDPALYKAGFMLSFLSVIQKECDTWALTIIDKFKRERQFQLKLTQIISCDPNRPDALTLEDMISEIVLINTRVELYLRYLRRKLQKDLESVPDKPKSDVADDCNRFFDQVKLVGEMQSLINNYISMEEFFMREMIIKATNVVDMEESASNVSKIVDSVFFLANKCLKRTLSSGNVEGICAMLNVSGTILTEQYGSQCLESKMKQYGGSSLSGTSWMRDTAYSWMASQSGVNAALAPIQTSASSASMGTMATPEGSGTSSGTSSATRRHRFLICVNSAEKSIDYTMTLQSGLERELELLFQKMTSSSSNKLHECLVSMTTSVTDKMREIVEYGVQELGRYVIKAQVKNRISDLSSMKFIISEEEFLMHEANDPWIEKFILSMQNILDEYQEVLVSGVFEKVVQKMCEEIVYRVEKVIREKSFNKLGGIQFDRDIRTLINFFTSSTAVWGVRERFTRLRQIANILNLENVSEMTSYWDRSSWKLNNKEVKELMTLRSDFRTEDIRKLVLF